MRKSESYLCEAWSGKNLPDLESENPSFGPNWSPSIVTCG